MWLCRHTHRAILYVWTQFLVLKIENGSKSDCIFDSTAYLSCIEICIIKVHILDAPEANVAGFEIVVPRRRMLVVSSFQAFHSSRTIMTVLEQTLFECIRISKGSFFNSAHV